MVKKYSSNVNNQSLEQIYMGMLEKLKVCKNTYNDMAKQPPAFFLKANTCVNLLDYDILARNETKVKVYFF